MQPLIHQYAPTDPFKTVVYMVLLLLVATLVKGTLMFMNHMFVNSLSERVSYDLRKQVFEHALKMDMGAFGDRRSAGLLTHLLGDVGGIRGGIHTLFGAGVMEPLKMIACLIGASLICWRLLALSLFLAPLAAYAVRKLGASIKRANRRAMEENALFFGSLTETLNGIQTVQAFTMEPSELERFERAATACWRKSMRIVFYIATAKPVNELLGIAVICIALIAGAYLVLNQQTHLFRIHICDRPLSIPSLLLFYGLLIGVSDPARKLSDFFGSLQGAFAAADRLYDLLDTASKITSPAQPRRLPETHKRLVFEKLQFHYHADQPVLRDFDLTIKFGETLAIVGPNGCGKSTLINLLLRFFDPISGAVRLDDVDLRECDLTELRKKIGYVTQHSQMFDDTVLNNIRYGAPDATEAQVIAAAKQAYAHQFITEKLSDGYRTIVGQGGNRLSGGQRQRLALARAILRNPEILILDEATSQVDIESEQLIHNALEKFTKGRTAIMITHRLSTLALADRVLVMDAGRIVDVGTHDELMGRCDLYRRLHEIQFKQSA